MNETLLRDDDLIVRSDGALRRITLNRSQALNAITLDMAIAMTALLRDWQPSPLLPDLFRFLLPLSSALHQASFAI